MSLSFLSNLNCPEVSILDPSVWHLENLKSAHKREASRISMIHHETCAYSTTKNETHGLGHQRQSTHAHGTICMPSGHDWSYFPALRTFYSSSTSSTLGAACACRLLT